MTTEVCFDGFDMTDADGDGVDYTLCLLIFFLGRLLALEVGRAGLPYPVCQRHRQFALRASARVDLELFFRQYALLRPQVSSYAA